MSRSRLAAPPDLGRSRTEAISMLMWERPRSSRAGGFCQTLARSPDPRRLCLGRTGDPAVGKSKSLRRIPEALGLLGKAWFWLASGLIATAPTPRELPPYF